MMVFFHQLAVYSGTAIHLCTKYNGGGGGDSESDECLMPCIMHVIRMMKKHMNTKASKSFNRSVLQTIAST